MTIGERIRMRRKSLNLTMQTIFELENIKTGNLSELEHDKYLPSVQTLIALSRVLHCSIDWLLTGEEYETNQSGFPDSLNADISESEQGHLYDCSTLEGVETDLITMYRLLPVSRQEDVFDIVLSMYKRHVEKKKDSIYSACTRSSSRKIDNLTEDGNARGGIA